MLHSQRLAITHPPHLHKQRSISESERKKGAKLVLKPNTSLQFWSLLKFHSSKAEQMEKKKKNSLKHFSGIAND
jgi:hypothetical protein